MKFPLLLLSITPLFFTGCSTVGRAVGSATHILGTGVNAVTRPLSGAFLADPGTSDGWKQGIQEVQKTDAANAR